VQGWSTYVSIAEAFRVECHAHAAGTPLFDRMSVGILSASALFWFCWRVPIHKPINLLLQLLSLMRRENPYRLAEHLLVDSVESLMGFLFEPLKVGFLLCGDADCLPLFG